LFKMDSNKPKVICLDELMKAPKLLQVIFTRMMLERMVGDVPLPEGSIIFATSNNSSDGVGDSMLAHAGNRVCIMKMAKPSVKEWLLWASESAVHRSVRSFVAITPSCLASYLTGDQDDNPYIFNPKKPQMSFVSPRSLAKSSIIVANKDAKGDLDSTQWGMARTGLAWYCGDDILNLPMLAVGAAGMVSVVGHIVGDRLKAMAQALWAGRLAEAADINASLLPVYTGLFRTQGVILTKAALAMQGLPAGPVRLPLVDATPEQCEQLRRDLSAGGVPGFTV
jgi:hypothetical protein